MSDPVEVAAAYLNGGRLAEAETICRRLLTSRPEDPQALHLLARAANVRGAHHQALEFVVRARRGDLAHLQVESAVAYRGLGASAPALAAARRAVALAPDVPNGYQTLASLLYPGDDYRRVLERMHACLQPASYVEIGVETGASLVLANPPTVAVGIDPRPRLLAPPRTVCKIFPLASDDYFARRDLRRDLEADRVGLAFIDGLHTFDQALRDLVNIERCADAGTVVLIHDCLAVDALTAERERKTAFWSGDVWKLMPILREFRPDLQVFTIATGPTGLGVVTGLDPQSTVLADHFDRIAATWAAMPFDPDPDRRGEQAAVVANRWEEVEARLRGARLGGAPPGSSERRCRGARSDIAVAPLDKVRWDRR